MEIAVQASDTVDVVKLPERMLMATASDVRSAITRLYDAGRSRFVLDLGATQIMDSSGLSVLVSALKLARANGGDVVLLRPGPNIRSLLELTRLQSVFEVFEDREAAVRRLT